MLFDRKDLSQKLLRRAYLIILILVLGGIFVYWSLACLFTGKCYFTYDSDIIELGVCRDMEYHPVVSIPQGTNILYLCGIIDGVTPRRGSISLFNEDGKSLPVESIFHHNQGVFYHPITRTKEFGIGMYKVEIWYLQSGRTVVQTEFEIIPP